MSRPHGPADVRRGCCPTTWGEPHTTDCPFRATDDNPIDYGGPGVFVPPLADDVDLVEALASGPGAIWTVPEDFRIVTRGHALHAQVTAQLALAHTICTDLGAAFAFFGIDAAELADVFVESLAPWLHRATAANVAGAADEAEYFDA